MSASRPAKPKLSYREQMDHLAAKGVTFERFSMADAARYLEANNNLFKLSSYRKNFERRPDGRYIRLDFGHLVDLAVIDSRLRLIVVQMALNIEHFAKVRLLARVTNDEAEDGYAIVEDYMRALPEANRRHLDEDRDVPAPAPQARQPRRESPCRPDAGRTVPPPLRELRLQGQLAAPHGLRVPD